MGWETKMREYLLYLVCLCYVEMCKPVYDHKFIVMYGIARVKWNGSLWAVSQNHSKFPTNSPVAPCCDRVPQFAEVLVYRRACLGSMKLQLLYLKARGHEPVRHIEAKCQLVSN